MEVLHVVLRYFKDKEDDDMLKVKKITLLVFSFIAATSTIGELICVYQIDPNEIWNGNWNVYLQFLFIGFVLVPILNKYLKMYRLAAWVFCGYCTWGSFVEVHRKDGHIAGAKAILIFVSPCTFFIDGTVELMIQCVSLVLIYIKGTNYALNNNFENGVYVLTKDNYEIQVSMTSVRFLFTIIFTYLQNSNTTKRIALLRRLKEEVEKKSKDNEIFFASMSHELRNPLNALLGSLDLLKDADDILKEELLQIAKTCSETLLNLIGNILDVSKIRANKLELVPSAVDLKEGISKIVKMMQSIANRKGIYVKLQFSQNFPLYLVVDFNKLNQVIINLLGNSIKFTEKGGVIVKVQWIPLLLKDPNSLQYQKMQKRLKKSSRKRLIESVDEIEEGEEREMKTNKYTAVFNANKHPRQNWRSRLRVRSQFEEKKALELKEERKDSHSFVEREREIDCKEGYVKMEIVDTGIGISAQNIHKLFNPFIQTQSGQKFGGTGLGLWISKCIIELMKGTIEIESRSGNGTNFIVVLPLTIDTDDEKKKNKISSKLNGKKCLLVEDLAVNQQIMSELLERQNIKVVITNNGFEGFQAFKNKRDNYYYLIITDLRMPRMSGQVMISEIRKYEQALSISQTPIIVTTGDPSENERLSCLQIGANEFLAKPIRMKKIVTLMKKILVNVSAADRNRNENYKEDVIILIVDEDRESSNNTKIFLHNYFCIQCFSYEEAIVSYKLRKERISLMILEENVGRVTGAEIAKGIRELENFMRNPRTPMFAISVKDVDRQRELYAEIDVDAFFTKPLSQDFLQTVSQLFYK
jgi:signal transduction histidine kinase/DNA-binding response OmpR family regulator